MRFDNWDGRVDLKKIFTFLGFLLLFLLVLAAAAAAGYWIIAVKQWPWWVLAVVAAGFAGIVIGILAVKKFLARRNEKRFVQRVISEDEASAEKAPREEKRQLKEVQEHWKQCVEKLQKSNLRKLGNPLYVLPWYMVIGESRSGKTSAIQNSNLSSPLTDVSRSATISGTRNCDWWFFDKAIILDTAGRYTIPVDESDDKKEWQTFLTLLSKYRKKEPVNGVIVTVSSESLLNEESGVLSEKGRNVRQRINQLMRILGARFPVYLLVTKMDLVNGFTDFCDHIPGYREEQVMGYANEENDPDCMQVIENCMEVIFERLQKLRRIFVEDRINSFAVSFPTEFVRLKSGLEAYAGTVFGKDVYQAAPLFRGIYFSSACRQGAPQSDLLQTTGIEYTNDSRENANKGYFLKNFFQAVLPRDRNIFTPVSEFLVWRKVTLSLSLFSIILICLGLCGVLTFSYYKNMETLESIDASMFRNQSSFLGQSDHILQLDRQRFAINRLSEKNKGWILPRLGLDHTVEAEKRLKNNYVTRVREDLVAPLDNAFYKRVRRLDRQTPYETMVGYADYAVRRIHLLQSAVSGEDPEREKAFEQSVVFLFSRLYTGMPESVSGKFASIYYDYLQWCKDTGKLSAKAEDFKQRLLDISVKSGSFNWLVSRAVSKTDDLTLADFIKGFHITGSGLDAAVEGAYTEGGRERIQSFLDLIESVFPSHEKFIQMENRFWAWYENRFFTSWHDFLKAFPSGSRWRDVTGNWQELAPLMATGHNPCFLFLEKMAKEIEAFKDLADQTPSWADTALRMQHVAELARVEKKKDKGSLAAKLEIKKEKLADRIFGRENGKKYLEMDMKKAREIDYNLVFAEHWNLYRDTLQSMSPAASYAEKCYHMFSDYFAAIRNPQKEDNSFSNTSDSLRKLKTLFTRLEESPEIFELIRGPFAYFKVYAVYHSATVLQSKWEEIVLSASSGTDPDQYHSIMFDPDKGLVWKFVNKWADPFITRNRDGYMPKSAFGIRLPFTDRFFRLLDKGERLSLEHRNSYTVRIQTLPAGVNEEADIKPYANILTLECADRKYELVNYNYPQSETFKWRPDSCGDTRLSILFRQLKLEKSYPGKMGFARFLDDFKDGTIRFSLSEFPDQMGHLMEKGISDITISYDISGIAPVLKLLHRAPPRLPDHIFVNIGTRQGRYPVPEKELQPSGKKEEQGETDRTSARIRSLIEQNKTFRITMETVPMGTNEEAEVKPVSSILWMNCGDRIVRLQNNNYPDTLTFEWDPSKCAGVRLFIHFPEITLSKKYPDFLAFIDDFNYQSRTFSSREFPDHKETLLKKGISSFTLGYRFSGELPFLESADIDKGTVGKKPLYGSNEIQKEHKGKESGSAADGSRADTPPTPTDEEKRSSDLFSKERLLSRDPKKYTIHVAVGPDREKLAAFARKHGLNEEKATVYEGNFNSGAAYGLVYGVFDSYRKAARELETIPQGAKQYSPWIRRFQSVFKEVE